MKGEHWPEMAEAKLKTEFVHEYLNACFYKVLLFFKYISSAVN